MAKQFGGIEKWGRRGGYAIRFRINGQSHRITSVPVGTRWVQIASRDLAEEILDEIRSEIRRSGDPVSAVAPYMAKSKLFGVEMRWLDFCEVQKARMEANQLSARRYEELAGHLSRGHLDVIRDTPLHAVDYSALEALQIDLLGKHAPKTVHNVIADVRTFLRWCVRRKMIRAVPEMPVTQLEEHVPVIPSRAEQQARLAGIRDEARGYFLARGLLGVRNQEAIRARLEDYRRGDKDEIVIRGKGRRFRVLPVPAELAEWVRQHRPAMAEAGTPLFVNPRTGGEWTQASLTREWRRMEEKLELAHVKPNEALRHTFGTRSVERLMVEGMSREEAQAAIMRVMGHTSKATSDRYVKLAAETMRDVIE